MIAQNGIGIKFTGFAANYEILNNNIQDNTNYNLYLNGTGNTVNVANNWWGTVDAQQINQTIYDFKNDFNLGAETFIRLS
jgi:hypothetical protein